jgi:hypothetical protein
MNVTSTRAAIDSASTATDIAALLRGNRRRAPVLKRTSARRAVMDVTMNYYFERLQHFNGRRIAMQLVRTAINIATAAMDVASTAIVRASTTVDVGSAAMDFACLVCSN